MRHSLSTTPFALPLYSGIFHFTAFHSFGESFKSLLPCPFLGKHQGLCPLWATTVPPVLHIFTPLVRPPTAPVTLASSLPRAPRWGRSAPWEPLPVPGSLPPLGQALACIWSSQGGLSWPQFKNCHLCPMRLLSQLHFPCYTPHFLIRHITQFTWWLFLLPPKNVKCYLGKEFCSVPCSVSDT